MGGQLAYQFPVGLMKHERESQRGLGWLSLGRNRGGCIQIKQVFSRYSKSKEYSLFLGKTLIIIREPFFEYTKLSVRASSSAVPAL